MAAPTNPAHVKKVLANPEPSTHGPSQQIPMRWLCVRFQGIAEADRRALSADGDADDPKRSFDLVPSKVLQANRARGARVENIG